LKYWAKSHPPDREILATDNAQNSAVENKLGLRTSEIAAWERQGVNMGVKRAQARRFLQDGTSV
jgi:hypothetical protein